MNLVLTNNINTKNYKTILTVLNAYRYSPISRETDNEKIKSFLSSEIKKEILTNKKEDLKTNPKA